MCVSYAMFQRNRFSHFNLDNILRCSVQVKFDFEDRIPLLTFFYILWRLKNRWTFFRGICFVLNSLHIWKTIRRWETYNQINMRSKPKWKFFLQLDSGNISYGFTLLTVWLFVFGLDLGLILGFQLCHNSLYLEWWKAWKIWRLIAIVMIKLWQSKYFLPSFSE